MLGVEWSRFRLSRPGRAVVRAQSERPIRVTTPLRGGVPALHSGVYGGQVARPSMVPVPVLLSCPSLLSARPVLCPAWDRSLHPSANSAFLTRLPSPATPPPLLRPHVTDSTHPPGPVYHSTHSLSIPHSPPIRLSTTPSPPKSIPSRPMIASHSLDRYLLHEVPRSKRQRASCQGGIAQRSIPPKRIGGRIGQSCKVLRDR